ncbi:Calcineurin-like phosphoesterase [Bradyrhizobium lablabi]|uniref:Calcineurin-like phosphoesterase n=1 Tax=Bradyrhizobium lablabi TaxID=722472 RepID=A0A1M6X8V4_9BRAD|nr:metallophosphoesterase [Bradyrhizobium lablabi]SHL02364.1 Calcineurin-like phosphoesterase [Bradyrhizobium lablabi]
MNPVIDPRDGDVEDDASSTKRRSLLSLAGSLLAEISLPKLILSWTMLFVVPGLLLGLAPLVASAWVSMVSRKITSPLLGIWPALLLVTVLAIGLFGVRSLFRMAESSFWSLNSLAVEPIYVACREGLRHLVEKLLQSRLSESQLATLRAGTAGAAGIIIFAVASAVVTLCWPSSRWLGNLTDLASPHDLVSVALANSIVLVSAYLAVAALVWAFADATMPQPRDFGEFPASAGADHTWRVAHLSDIHVVGERYGFRIESGRAGPRGNERLNRLLTLLDFIHANNPLDTILITGDMTDAGRSAEWSELLDALKAHPRLAERILILPGNHDLNIVDRANPARLDLPTSPNRKLRRLRFLSAVDALHGERVRLIDQAGRCLLAGSLSEALKPHRTEMAKFAEVGRPRLSRRLNELWAAVFPMVLPPDRDDGLGIILLDSNADTHFSFTNALGMISVEQVRGIEIAAALYPQARWIIALHHHVIEYPKVAKVLSERIGTALVNGNWFVRRLQALGGRVVLMHGHRHIDWIGKCAGLAIVSAPSPVMEATDGSSTYFYIHTLATRTDGQFGLLTPERVVVDGQP